MFTFVVLVLRTISLIIDLIDFRYFIAVVAPHFSVWAISLPDPNGSATKLTFAISISGSRT